MQTVDAIYTGGTFKPLGNVSLAENQQVRITIQPDAEATEVKLAPDWLVNLRAHQAYMGAKYGILPDSTPDIHADRYRDA